MRFQSMLGELAYTGLEIYDDPGLGISLRYERGITKATVYLYDLGLEHIPDDIRSETVTQFFQQACSDVFVSADCGSYLDLKTRASQYLHLPADSLVPMYLWAAFYYRQAPGPGVDYLGFRFSHVLLRTDGGYINKVRYTYPAHPTHTATDAERGMMHFLLDWYNAIPKD